MTTLPRYSGALDLGASGFVPKSAGIETIREAISSVFGGEGVGDVWKPEDVDLAAEGDAEIAELISKLSTLTPQQTRVFVDDFAGPAEQTNRL